MGAGWEESRERSCKPAPPTRSDPSSSSLLLDAEVTPIDSSFDPSTSFCSSALSSSEPIEDLRPRLVEGPGERATRPLREGGPRGSTSLMLRFDLGIYRKRASRRGREEVSARSKRDPFFFQLSPFRSPSFRTVARKRNQLLKPARWNRSSVIKKIRQR